MFSPKFRQLFPYGFVVFLAFLGFALPLPILPEMFLGADNAIVDPSFSREKRALLLGIFMATYPIGQLFGSPLLGQLSDRYGRKRMILWSLVGTMIGYVITAICVMKCNLIGVFAGLLITGFFEGNFSIAQSVIGDICEKESKSYFFGWIHFYACMGFIIGPLIGAKLADPNFVPWFDYSVPFSLAAIMCVLGFFVLYRYGKETVKANSETRHIPFFTSFKTTLSIPNLRKSYFITFFLYLGLFFYFRFFPVFLQSNFHFSPSMVGYAIVYDALMFACAIPLIKPIAKRYSPTHALTFFSLLLSVFLFLFVVPNTPHALWFTIPPIGICVAVVMTKSSVLVSNNAHESHHGSAMGCLASIQVLAEITTGLVGGLLVSKAAHLPLILGSLSVVFGSGFLLLFRKSLHTVQVEVKEES